MNLKLKKTFEGKVVNKKLTINTGVDEFPRYVVEYLIDNYCSEESFHDDLHRVVKRLRENFVHGAETEKIRHYIRENRNHSIIANLEARLVETENKYWGMIGAINENYLNLPEALVRQYPMILSGGMWGTIEIEYDESEIYGGKIRPFKVTGFTPFQISMIDIREFLEKRRLFSSEEWIDILVNSFGLDPERMTQRQKLLYIMRAVPLIESNSNFVELGPRETGKTYLYRNISYYAHVLSGGKATPANLFINLNTGRVGLVGTLDAVVFDEIANTEFTDPKSLVSIMQGYMQDAKFSRGKKEILAFASIVMVGNLDVQGLLPHEKYLHLFEPLPSFLQVEAFIDRIHCYLPGWEIPKLGPESTSNDYGFIIDYFCEIIHELRRTDIIGPIKHRFELVDTAKTSQGITTRDQRGIEKTLSGLLKLLYPHGEITDDELAELLSLAIEARQRVRNQLLVMAPGEYHPVIIGAKMPENRLVIPKLLDADRKPKVVLPQKPLVGEITGLAVTSENQGVILRFEIQTTKGSGRIIPLGSIQRVMRESIEAAVQFIKAHHQNLGVTEDWKSKDIAILALLMGLPKEGPSAGITMVTGIVSALRNVPVRSDVAMTGEITIMGKVIGVGGTQAKVQAAIEAGIKRVIVPKENEKELAYIPDYLKDRVETIYVSNIYEVLDAALVS
jgi:ATP-dependent Lon protease